MLFYRMEKTWNILERITTLLKTVQLCLRRVKEHSQLKLFVQHMIPSKQKPFTTLLLLFVSTLAFYNIFALQPTKILFLQLKYEIIMVPSNHSFCQYFDSNVGLFSIAPL